MSDTPDAPAPSAPPPAAPPDPRGIRLTIDGRTETARGAPIERTLLEHLRATGRVGTKEGCGEGDCGACTVAMLGAGPDGAPRWEAVDSCLVPLASLDGREVVTVEGLAPVRDPAGPPGPAEPHPVQRAMVERGGSQCGFCTPGIVMSLFAARSNGALAGEGAEIALEGNLCRCTGYLPILRAAADLAERPAGPDEPLEARLRAPLPPPAAGAYEAPDGARFERPASLAAALALLAEPDARAVAGGTDLLVAARRRAPDAPAPALLVSLERVPELRGVTDGPDGLRIGAGVPLSDLEAWLATEAEAGSAPDERTALRECLRLYAARQVRNRATLGGSLGTASPIGDLAPVLLAADALVEIEGPAGRREVPIDRFFLGYRRPALEPGELIVAARLPRPAPPPARRVQRFLKVGKRGSDDISIVALALDLHLDRSEGGGERIARARLGFGGVAATPVRAAAVEGLLEGRAWDAATAREAAARLRDAFEPLDDMRASAAYRRALCGNLLLLAFEEDAGRPGAEAAA